MMQSQVRNFIWGVSCLILSASGAVHAEVLASEHFDYNQASLNRQNGGMGWKAAWESDGAVLSDDGVSLSFQGLPSTGGRVSDASRGGSRRQLQTPIHFGEEGIFYVGVLVAKVDGGSVDFDFSDGKNARWRWRYNARGDITIGVAKSTEAFAGSYQSPATLLLVTKCVATAGKDTVSIQVYESGDALSEPIEWDATATAKTSITADTFRIFGNVEGVQIDSVIIGTTFADVVSSQ